MKSRPILYTGAMVRALLREVGPKTQTRRICKNEISPNGYRFDTASGTVVCHNDYLPPSINVMRAKAGCVTDWLHEPWDDFCPYGQPGDRLWVRETAYYDLAAKFPKVKDDSVDMDAVYYRADGECCAQIPECACAEVGKPKWTPSILVPRWASRITLEITEVRVQRLQEISEADAIAEGCTACTFRDGRGHEPATVAYRHLWESIHGAGSWAANPWVWAITFKKVLP